MCLWLLYATISHCKWWVFLFVFLWFGVFFVGGGCCLVFCLFLFFKAAVERVTTCSNVLLLQLWWNLSSSSTLVHSYCESLIKLLLGIKILQVWKPWFALHSDVGLFGDPFSYISRGLIEQVVRQMRLHME